MNNKEKSNNVCQHPFTHYCLDICFGDCINHPERISSFISYEEYCKEENDKKPLPNE